MTIVAEKEPEVTTPAEPETAPAAPPGGNQARRIVHNILTLSGTQALTWLLAFAVMRYLPGYAGDVGLGQLTLAGSYTAFFNLLVTIGSGSVVVRDVARDNDRDGDYLVAACLQRLTFCVVLGALTPLVVHVLNYAPIVRTFVYVSVAFSFIGHVTGAVSEVLRGREKIPRQSLATVLEKVMSTTAVLTSIYLRLPLWCIIVSYGVGSFASLTVLLPAIRGRVPRPRRRHIGLARQIVVSALPFFTTELFVTIYSQGYPQILDKFASTASIGWYGMVTRLFGTSLFIPGIITGALFPTITRMRVTNPDVVPKMAQTLIRLIIIGAVPVASFLVLTPGEIIKILHYPDSFRNAIPVLVLFGVGLVLWFLSIPIGMLLTVYDRQKELSKATAVAAFAVLPIGSGLVHATQTYFQNGAIGAAVSHILIEMFLLSCYARLLPKELLPARFLLRHGTFVLLSAAPMAVVLLLLRAYISPLATLLMVLPMTVVFLVLCYVTRCIVPEDLAIVRNALQNRRG